MYIVVFLVLPPVVLAALAIWAFRRAYNGAGWLFILAFALMWGF